jgi:hypothetical protein
MGGDRGNCQSVIVLKWRGSEIDIMDRVRGTVGHKVDVLILWRVPCSLKY